MPHRHDPEHDDRDRWRSYAGAIPPPPEPGEPCPPSGTLASYLDGRLTGRDMELFEEHLVGCSPCRADVAELRALLIEVDPLPALPGPALIRRAQDLRAARMTRRRLMHGVARWSAAAAAAVVVAFGGLYAGSAASAKDSALDAVITNELSFGLLVTGDADDSSDALVSWTSVLEEDE